MPIPIPTKLLLGWMDETDAMRTLLTECVADPLYTEDSARKLWSDYTNKVAALAPRACSPPLRLSDLTQKEKYAFQHLLDKHKKNSNVLDVLKLDEPGKLVVHQLWASASQSDRYREDMKDPKKRLHLCLGRNMQNQRPINRARKEGDCLIKEVPHWEYFAKTVSQEDFEVEEGNRHIAVKEFDGRLLLSAGYHRACVSMYRNSPDDTVLPLFAVLESDTQDGFFSVGSKVPRTRDMVKGAVPPVLSDFLDDSLCITLPLRKRRVELVVNLTTRQWERRWVDDES